MGRKTARNPKSARLGGMKFYCRALVKSDVHAHGIGVELFRLSDADPEELTSEELDAAVEAGGDSSSGEIAVMRLYDDEIGDSCATTKQFAEALDSFSDVKRLHLHINSSGSGDVFSAQAIHYMLADFNPRKIAYIGSLAAGTATLIMCACDEIIAGWNSSLVFCEPWGMAYGDADAIEKRARDLEAITIPIVSVYKTQTRGKLTEKEIRRLMADETQMTAQDALKKGFITAVRGKISR